MIKIQSCGNLSVRMFKPIMFRLLLIVIVLQTGVYDKLSALENVNISIIEEIKTLLNKEQAFIFNPLPGDVEVSYDIDKKFNYAIDEISSFTIRLNNINKKTRRFTGVITARLIDSTDIEAPLSGAYEEYIQVPVLKVAMRMGEIIRTNDVDKIKINATKLKYNTVLEAVNLINKTPKNSLAAYQAINEKQLVQPKIIHKNDLVMAIYERNNLTLKLEVIALDSGANGETIRVKNQRSGVILDAVISDRNIVYVK